MSPHRPKHQHNISIGHPSDYESDANYLSDIPFPPLERTDDELNLLVLRRHNPEVVSIEYVAPYAVVYQFSPESQQWEKSGIEGTAFVCTLMPTRAYPERCEVTVLNRRGLANFNVELLSSSDVEVTEDYVILQSGADGKPHVYGLWVFSEPLPSSTSHHRGAIAQKIQDCAQKVEEARKTIEDSQFEGHEEDIDEIIRMDRQLSLKQLFGQQRQQDDAWSVRSHSSRRPSAHFTPSIDAELIQNPSKYMQTPCSPAVSAQSSGQGKDVLLDLFRKAGEGYQNMA